MSRVVEATSVHGAPQRSSCPAQLAEGECCGQGVPSSPGSRRTYEVSQMLWAPVAGAWRTVSWSCIHGAATTSLALTTLSFLLKFQVLHACLKNKNQGWWAPISLSEDLFEERNTGNTICGANTNTPPGKNMAITSPYFNLQFTCKALPDNRNSIK